MITPTLKDSEKLIEIIKQEINLAGGHIDFARFMQLALYAPELGYYNNGTHKFGRIGDFITAPEISPLFAKCFARQFRQILNDGDILEFGAGSGIFARDLLLELESQNALPAHYFILEISSELREQQLQRFKNECPQFLTKIVWLDTLPATPIKGIIFANEVLDAMPVHCFEWSNKTIKERCVAIENEQFVWRNSAPSKELKQAVEIILAECTLPDFYQSEINLFQSAWIKSIAPCLAEGAIFLVDYGYGRREYYHPERQHGTLTCFQQHRRHNNPLIQIGLQDITAHVDFTRVAESASQQNLNLAGFTTQAAFLLACGLLDIAEQNSDVATQYTQSQAIKTLTLPSEMGEVIKVMALTKKIDASFIGFQLQDRRQDL